MDLSTVELSHYGLQVRHYSIDIELSGVRSVEMKFESGSAYPDSSEDKFLADASLMSKIRNSTNPAVTDQFDKLLTLLALSG